jgi:hypothetical protein
VTGGVQASTGLEMRRKLRSPMSEAEENKALVRKYYEETWVKGNVGTADEFTAADYVEHGCLPNRIYC